MKHLLFFIFFIPLCMYGQVRSDSIISRTDSLLQTLSEQIEDIQFRMRGLDRYKIYQIDNIYNVLKLDTKTGRIDMVQWSLDDDKEFTVSLNRRDLSGGESFCGMFELYPTKNMYQMILLNKVTGQTWHVQWGMEDKKRWIREIR